MKKSDSLMWFITGRYGLYYASNQPTRREAIDYHVGQLGDSWNECKARGDRAVRLRLSEQENRNG